MNQSATPQYVNGPCGNLAEFDEGSGIGYRCTQCGAVIGSVGMPGECRALYEQEKTIGALSDTH